ncbi:hypothetical protein BBP40_002300 [Aspergillus hancockii]|nr:hypothetical protein BBP40_002300 [Aspergillus hancockii]
MRRPGMTFLYRLECNIAAEDINVGAPHGGSMIRSIAPIVGGIFKGPSLSGTVVPGGADFATVIESSHSMTLDAHYTAKTDDGCYLYIRAHGLYRPGPSTEYAKKVADNPALRPPPTVTQDDVEFFSHLRIEAGAGKYNWLNGLVCIGVMSCEEDRILIDAYYLTNFEGIKPDDVMVKRGEV